MTFSIELLPAPLGPITAQISPSATSKLIELSAWTPPNDRQMSWIWRMGAPAAMV